MNFEPEIIIESPGRINLIGEHLDYNGGNVLPAAINLTVKLSFRKNGTSGCQIYSKSYDDRFAIDLNTIEISEKEWHNYFLGVIHFIEQKRPNTLSGFDCILESDLPIGSGVSSSAALECGIALGLDQLFNLGLDAMEIITIGRDAEHHFVGTKCGIMDQFAVVMGQKDKLIQLNCNDLNFEYVPADLSPYNILLLNTNVSHNLATSEYNLRRQECELGLRAIQADYPHYKVLAEVPMEVIEHYQTKLAAKTYNRLVYVTQENGRTKTASKALDQGDLNALGELLFASHDGLRHLYEVSCDELDFLVDFAKTFEGVIGARMMGGGFGGCTINLVHKSQMEEFVDQVAKAYQKKFNLKLTPIPVAIGSGVRRTL